MLRNIARILIRWVNPLSAIIVGGFAGVVLSLAYFGTGFEMYRVIDLLDLTTDFGQEWAGPAPKVTPLPKIPVKEQTAKNWEEVGNQYYSKSQFQLAVDAYTKAIELEPNEAQYYTQRANAFRELKNYAAAFRDYDKALELADGYYSWAYENRGIAWFELNNYPKAVADFTRAVEINRKRYSSFYMRGRIYFRLLAYQNAIDEFTQALEAKSDYSKAFFYRGLAHLRLQKWEKAIEDFSQYIELDPFDYGAYFNRAVAEERLGYFAEAAEDFQTYLDLNPLAEDRRDVEGRIQRLLQAVGK